MMMVIGGDIERGDYGRVIDSDKGDDLEKVMWW